MKYDNSVSKRRAMGVPEVCIMCMWGLKGSGSRRWAPFFPSFRLEQRWNGSKKGFARKKHVDGQESYQVYDYEKDPRESKGGLGLGCVVEEKNKDRPKSKRRGRGLGSLDRLEFVNAAAIFQRMPVTKPLSLRREMDCSSISEATDTPGECSVGRTRVGVTRSSPCLVISDAQR